MRRFLIATIMLAALGGVGFSQTVADIVAAKAALVAADAALAANAIAENEAALKGTRTIAVRAIGIAVRETVKDKDVPVGDILAVFNNPRAVAKYMSTWRKDHTLLAEVLPPALTNLDAAIAKREVPAKRDLNIAWWAFKHELLLDKDRVNLAVALCVTKSASGYESGRFYAIVYKKLTSAERATVLEKVVSINASELTLRNIRDLVTAYRKGLSTKVETLDTLDGYLVYLSDAYNLDETLTEEERAVVKEKARRIDSLRNTIFSLEETPE